MRKLFLLILLFSTAKLMAQPLNNEWIDYAKTYYKFKIGKTGLYRIRQVDLPASLQGVAANQFQLWRNGKQVVLFTSVASNPLASNDYIEFWGEKNDGYKEVTNGGSGRPRKFQDRVLWYQIHPSGM